MSQTKLLLEASRMVKGMIDYYSESKVSVEDIQEALRPLLEKVEKDNAGYIAYRDQYQVEVKSQGEIH